MKVVRAQREQFSDLLRMAQELHAESVKIYPFASAGMDANGHMLYLHKILGWCLDASVVVLMVYDGDVPAGYMHLQFCPFVGSENSTIASSTGFYIRPEYRKSKAVFHLYRSARAVLREHGITHVQACVLTANTDVTKLYQSHGYDAVATVFQRDIRKVNPDERKQPGQEIRQGGSGSDEDCAGGAAGLS